MKKTRFDWTWHRLKPGQRELLDHWLFEEHLGYADALTRVQKEFGLEATLSSVGRYYRRRVRERQVEDLAEAQFTANSVNGMPVSTADLREAAVKLAGKTALKLAGEGPQELAQLVAFTRLLLESEENELRRGRLKLAQQQFDYATAAELVEDLPQIRSYLLMLGDDQSLDETEKMKRFHAILFGKQDPREIVKGNYTTTFTGKPPQQPGPSGLAPAQAEPATG